MFIDFKSAYNTILPERLFGLLRNIYTEDETNFIKEMHSHLKLKAGKHSFRLNIGVPQGSTLAPEFFNIYINKLLSAAGVSEQDILAYADDLLVFCGDKEQLKKIIRLINNLCAGSNVKLNASKSAIVEFVHRRNYSKNLMTIDDTFEGIPIKDSYRYLGMLLTQKLSAKDHNDWVAQKATFIYHCLAPLIHKASPKYRYRGQV